MGMWGGDTSLSISEQKRWIIIRTFKLDTGQKCCGEIFLTKKYDHIYKYSNLALCVNSLLKDMGHHVDYEILALRHAIKRPDIFVQHIFFKIAKGSKAVLYQNAENFLFATDPKSEILRLLMPKIVVCGS